MTTLACLLMLAPACLFIYAYVVYPVMLWLATIVVRRQSFAAGEIWPTVTLTVPVYNEAQNIRGKLDDLLALEYPQEKLQILVISDASTDATDQVASEYGDRGVELLRLPQRRGKTAAENAAGPAARGSIIVNSDATVRVPRHALKALVAAFADPQVGVASGRDVSVGAAAREENRGESKYVGYEMWLRSLETRLGSIVGASGCFYGIRARIYDSAFPEELSRDFAAALMARAKGLRAVSVDDAVCFVPRTGSVQSEFRRKVRTMARGLETLWYFRGMLNPLRYGSFALMLASHKLCRWLVYLSLPFAAVGAGVLAATSWEGVLFLGLASLGSFVGWLAWCHAKRAGTLTRPNALAAFAVSSVAAGVLAWFRVLRRDRSPTWEPTRRPA